MNTHESLNNKTLITLYLKVLDLGDCHFLSSEYPADQLGYDSIRSFNFQRPVVLFLIPGRTWFVLAAKHANVRRCFLPKCQGTPTAVAGALRNVHVFSGPNQTDWLPGLFSKTDDS